MKEEIENPIKLVSGERKRLRDELEDRKQFYLECKNLYKSAKFLVASLKSVIIQAKEYFKKEENFVANIDSTSAIVEKMKKISNFKSETLLSSVECVRISLWKYRLYVEKLAVSRLISDLVVELLGSSLTEASLKLAHLYNEISAVNLLSTERNNINVFGNTCPALLHPLRKLSINRILQIIAMKRAEKCSCNMISALLNKYFESEDDFKSEELIDNQGFECINGVNEEEEEEDEGEGEKNIQSNSLLNAQHSVSSSTSVEIYRALTKHLGKANKNESSLNQCLKILWRKEEKFARIILSISSKVAPELLESYSLTLSNKDYDNIRPRSIIGNKLLNYYQQVLWGEVGGFLEHILFWWSSIPFGGFPPSTSQNLREYIFHLKTTDFIPNLLLPSVNSLLDAMCCHLTSTSWDQLFRKTLVSAGRVEKDILSSYNIEGSGTGQLIIEMLNDLIQLNNSCESLYLSLEELPLVEQIPVLHRLDHSVHMVRLWTSSRCRNLAAKWNLDGFYCTCHSDISKYLQTLNALEIVNHGVIPTNTSVQVIVCIKMRAKLISEIQENIEKLKRTAKECIDILAKNCRIQSLAILHMSFPIHSYWRQNGSLPEYASDYVEKYLDYVLRPVFVATGKLSLEIQQSSSAMILRILCESWLEYVYLNKIKFSEWGAVQLLTDFGAIATWLMERVQLPKDLLNSLLSHEVLRRCEGVGRLLLRHRGESIKMTAAPSYKTLGNDNSTDDMPSEMYVTNQEQWLELRAPLKTNICCQL